MGKTTRTYAVFDVAREATLKEISDWRLANVMPRFVAQKLQGTFQRCLSADDAPADAWQTGPARQARLLSVCAHGTPGIVFACARAHLYTEAGGEANFYPEIVGAIVHLLVCDGLDGVAQSLVGAGKADAVIGYSGVFAFGGVDDGGTLTAVATKALEADAEILFALAEGNTVAEAVAAAKAYAMANLAPATDVIDPWKLDLRALRVRAWERANLEYLVNRVDFEGDGTATLAV